MESLFLLFLFGATFGFRPCDDEPWKSKPWCDLSLSFEDRARSLTSELTLDEKILLMGNDASGIERLHLPDYQWWSEALHGVGKSPGVTFDSKTPYATSFPQVSLTSQSFDRQLFHRIASTISTEARAMSNVGNAHLTFWSPNVNIFRDPRWGRGQETPGEDPYLTSSYAVEFVRGMQEGEDNRYLKVSSCCKHYTAYDLDNWHGVKCFWFDAKVKERDMQDTFQVPFESCVKKARASALMCSYNAVNGVPSCASKELLYGVARDSWGFEGYITADCDAVDTIENYHHYTNNSDTTVALAVTATCDIDCGDYYKNHLKHGVKVGLLEEKDIDQALINLFKVQMRLGYFDPLEGQVYASYGLDRLNTHENHALALQAAREGLVLLENRESFLPVSLASHQIAVMGPFAEDTEVMLGNYEGIPEFIRSVADGVKEYQPNVIIAPGCSDVYCTDTTAHEEAIQKAKGADLIIFAVGINQKLEREGLDRETLLLPEGQRQLIDSVLQDLGMPIILLLFSGCGSLDVSAYVSQPLVKGVLGVGYPGMFGGQAIAEVLTGDVNPSGRTVNTWYYNEYVENVDFFDMAMRPDPSSQYPGRTYRFYEGPVQYPFGYGLSYSHFSHKVTIGKMPSRRLRLNHRTVEVEVFVHVTNDGPVDGSESVLLFLKSPLAGKKGFPLKTLGSFDRVNLKKGEEKEVRFVLTEEELHLTNEEAKFVILEGEWTVQVEESSAVFVL